MVQLFLGTPCRQSRGPPTRGQVAPRGEAGAPLPRRPAPVRPLLPHLHQRRGP